MQKLLAIEWLKIKNYRTFWILSGLFLLLLPLWNYVICRGIFQVGPNDKVNLLSRAYYFPQVWDNIGFWVRFFSGLIAIVIVILTTNEYQFRTNRQNVIDGWSRLQFFHAKWGMVLMLSIAVTLYALLMGTVFGLAVGGSFAGFQYHLSKLLYVFLLSLNYSGFALTLSLLLRRSGMTIMIFLLYLFIIEKIAQYTLNWKISSKPGDLLPMQSAAELLPFPSFDTAQAAMGLQSGPSEMVLSLACIAWIIIYYFIGRRKLLRSDW